MTELFLTNDTSDKLTPEILAQLNLKFNINFERDGYSISTKDDSSIVYGFYDDTHSQIYSIYPGRSVGKWLDILKMIDQKIEVDIIDYNFYEEYVLRNPDISEDEFIEKLLENVKLNRKLLKLN